MNEKVLLVTGASSDIGVKLISKVCNNYDYIIAHYCNHDDNLKNLKKELNDKLITIKGNFLDENDTNKFV